MAKSRFEKGVRFRWNQQVFCVEETVSDGAVLLKNLSFAGKLEVYDLATLETAWKDFKLVFEVFGHNAAKRKGDHIATSFSVADLAQLPPKIREETLRRYKIVLPLYKRPASQRTRKDVEEYAMQFTGPESNEKDVPRTKKGRRPLGEAVSAASIERWLKALIDSNGDPRALAVSLSKQGCPTVPRLGEDVEEIIREVFLECVKKPKKRTARDVRDAINLRIVERNETLIMFGQTPLRIPSLRMVHRRIELSGQYVAILGRPQSRAEVSSSTGGPGPRPLGIGERIEIDSTPLDIILIDEEDGEIIGRPTLTIGIDKYSGAPWGMSVSFIEPGWRTVSSCILHGMLPKPDCCAIYGTKNPWSFFGTPATIVTDNGPEFYNTNLEDALTLLQVTDWIRSPRGIPRFRGSIERFMRTSGHGLVHKLDGTTYANTVERGDYQSEKMACYTLEAFMKMLHMWLLDEYAQEWHNIKGGTKHNFMGGVPAHLWAESEQLGFTLPMHHSAEEVYILLLYSDERVLGPDGINIDNINYWSPELAALRSKLPAGFGELPLKRDWANLDFIYVMNPLAGLAPMLDTDNQIEWIRVPSTMPEYTDNLPKWRHDRIVAELNGAKSAVDYSTLLRARTDREIFEKIEYRKARRVRDRKKGTHWVGNDTKDLPGMVPTRRIDAATAANESARAEVTLHKHRKSASGSQPLSPAVSETLVVSFGEGASDYEDGATTDSSIAAGDDLDMYMGSWRGGFSPRLADIYIDDKSEEDKDYEDNGR